MRPPTEMELRVTQAILDKQLTGHGDPLARARAGVQALDLARAAIRAMYEPTTAMMMATRTKSVAHAIENYKAMISAASPPEESK